MKKLTKEEFVKKAREIHGNKYDYSKVEYVNNRTKVCIICPEHGEFWQIPSSHLQGKKCKKCGAIESSIKQRKNTKLVINDFKRIHGNKYDYSKVEYVNDRTKVCIICPEHGEFWQTPNNHLKGKGCSKCYGNAKKTKEEFVKKAREIHGNKYDYSKVEYNGTDIKVCIICPEHGEFWQTPYNHLKGQGCFKCCGKEKLTTEEFIKRAIKVHGDKYDYSKVEYINIKTPVCIICHKKDKYGNEHGEFWQKPIKHLIGENCPSCKSSKLENIVESILKNKKINFEKEKRFSWLGSQRLDFYLPDYNIGIECQGIQHFEPVDFAGKGVEWAMKEYEKNINFDICKQKLCKENNIKLFYINYNDKKIEDSIIKIIYDSCN